MIELDKLHHADARELAKDIDDNSIDMIFTDPPYLDEFIEIYAWLSEVAARVLKPGGFLMTYLSCYRADEIMVQLLEHLQYYWIVMSYEPQSNPKFWKYNIIQTSKPIFVFAKPPARKAYHQMRTSYQTNVDKAWHKWGQPVGLARYYIHCLTPGPGSLVFDPFAGGGTTAIACIQEKRHWITCEIDEQTFHKTSKRLEIIQPTFNEFFTQSEIGV